MSWLHHLPVTQKVAGSSPASSDKSTFCKSELLSKDLSNYISLVGYLLLALILVVLNF